MAVRVYLKQAWNLMKQNPLFSTLYIVGTGDFYRYDNGNSYCVLCAVGSCLSGDEQDAYIGGEIR